MLGFFAVKTVGILMAVFASNYTIFAIGRFLIGGGQVGYFLPGFVLGNQSISQSTMYLFSAEALRVSKALERPQSVVSKQESFKITIENVSGE